MLLSRAALAVANPSNTEQKVITRNNVPAEVEKAVTSIQDFRFEVSQYAQVTLRDVVGGLSLDDLLSEREQILQREGRCFPMLRISNIVGRIHPGMYLSDNRPLCQ